VAEKGTGCVRTLRFFPCIYSRVGGERLTEESRSRGREEKVGLCGETGLLLGGGEIMGNDQPASTSLKG